MDPQHIELRQQQGATLRRLCQQGDAMLVQHMIRSGAPVDSCQSDGCTGLWLAAEQGHLDVVRLLCDHGANVHVSKQPGDVTPLYIAAQNGHTSVVTLLLQHGALPNAAKATGATPLYIASQQNFSDIVAVLIRAGAGVSIANNQGITPLAISCFLGNLESLRLLLQAGADPEAPCGGKTPIEWATSNGNGNAVGRVLEQFREARLRDQERRNGLARGEAVTPLQHQQAAMTAPGGGRSLHQDPGGLQQGASPSPWYTPQYLYNSHANHTAMLSTSSSSPVPSRGRPVSTAIGLQRSPYRASSRGTMHAQHMQIQSHPQQRSTESIIMPPAATGAGGFACGGALSPAAIAEEARRNEMFRKQISKKPAGVPLQAAAAASTTTKADLYAVSQEWSAFKERLARAGSDLELSRAEVTHSWMYSYSTVAQYENTLRGVRRQQQDAVRANRDKLEQDKTAKGKNGFTFPPLAGDRLESLRHFVSQGSEAKGPPPASATTDDGPEDSADAGKETPVDD